MLIPILLSDMAYFLHKLRHARLVDKVGEDAVFFKRGCRYASVGNAELLLDVFQTHPGIRQHDRVGDGLFYPLQYGAIRASARRQPLDAQGIGVIVKYGRFRN